MTTHARRGLLLAALLLLPAGCGGREDGAPPAAPGAGEPPATVAWDGPPAVPEGEAELPVAEFNALAGSGEAAWARSPFLAAAEFLRLDRAEAGRTSLVVETPAEGGTTATAIATLEGLLDDSVDALRYALELEQADEGVWRLRSARAEQRCRPGRGHEDFGPDPCV